MAVKTDVKHVQAWVPSGIVDAIDLAAQRDGLSRSVIVREALVAGIRACTEARAGRFDGVDLSQIGVSRWR